MFRAVLWTLRQRRYKTLAALMLVIALGCAGAGTFEIHRFREKRHDNGALVGNAHATPVALTPALVPLVGRGPAPGATAIRYRTATVSGTYEAADQQYVAEQSQGGHQGFYVLTPLRTAAATLLVVRGFVAATTNETRPAAVAAPPAGPVRVTGRLQTGQTSSDRPGRLGHGEITSINPADQAARSGQPTFDAYLTLLAAQPGTAGLTAVPKPGLSNPTGGAGELQLLSYVVQWYVFALLALAAPFLFSRSEIRDARRRFLGVDPDAQEFGLEPGDASDDAPPALGGAGASAARGALAVRGAGTLARPGDVSEHQWQRARRLADRYGRALGVGDDGGPVDPAPAPPAVQRRIGGVPDVVREPAAPSSASVPHRSDDTYHGRYNDYLWQLALADGATPDSAPARPADAPDSVPRVIDGTGPPAGADGSREPEETG